MHLGTKIIGNDPKLGDITEVTLGNPANGMLARFITIGAALKNLLVPDVNGQLADIVLGYDTWQEYLDNDPHMGVVCGRFANRIKGAKFTLNDKVFTLDVNNGPNSLHGGNIGFSRKNWTIERTERTADAVSVTMMLESRDGDEGYPGNLTVWVTYTLRGMSLEIDYKATCDADTVLNLTNHTYFNFREPIMADILSHIVTIPAQRYLELDADCCPTGKVCDVAGTPFDLREPQAIGSRIFADDRQLKDGKGFDTNYCFETPPGEMKLVAQAYDPGSTRAMKVHTDMPGVQFYTGNWLKGTIGKGGFLHRDYDGFCFETQQWPAAPNFEDFPSSILKAGETFTSKTIYQFESFEL